MATGGIPDLDNVLKPTFDALEGLAFADDAQLSDIHAARVDLNSLSLEHAVSGGEAGAIATHLIARKGEADLIETRIVEFVPADCDHESDTRLAALRAVIAERPVWHLDIIEYAQPRDARPPAPSVVADWIAEARRLVPASGAGAVALARRSVAGALFLLRVADGERYQASPDLSDSLINGLEADSAISAEEAETLRSFHAASTDDDARQGLAHPSPGYAGPLFRTSWPRA